MVMDAPGVNEKMGDKLEALVDVCQELRKRG
jgi:hypothetical protein